MDEEQSISIAEQLDQYARVQVFLGLDETTMDLTDGGDKPQSLIHKLSCLLGWCSSTKPDNELLVKLHHIGVKMLR